MRNQLKQAEWDLKKGRISLDERLPPITSLALQTRRGKKAYPRGYEVVYRGISPQSVEENVIPSFDDRSIFTFTTPEPAAYYQSVEKNNYHNKYDFDSPVFIEKLSDMTRGGTMGFIYPKNIDIKDIDMKGHNFGFVNKVMGDKYPTTDDVAFAISNGELPTTILRNIDDGSFGDEIIYNNVPGQYLKSMFGSDLKFDLNDPKPFAKGGEVQSDTIDPVDMYNKTRYQVNGIPINHKPLSGTDPIGEAVMWGIGGGIASSLIKRSFPRYGGLFAGAMFGDDGKKDNMLIVPKDPSKSNIPVAKNVLNQEVKDYYATDVIPRDVIHADNQSFITDENFVYDILPNEHFNPGVAGYYDRLNDRIAINNSYATDKNTLDNVMSHEVDHIYNNQYPLDKQHDKILNSAYTVQDDNISRAARSARKPSEKRATNKNLRHSLYTELKEQLGHKPTVKELDEFIDSIPD
ncbi:MAG: hypothetical protein IJ341_09425 [Bacteroidales bacterium]|nr:hypothetical protein [Bacteroidales bacterium]